MTAYKRVRLLSLALDIKSHPVIPGEDRCLGPLKAEPLLFGASNRYSPGIWMSRIGLFWESMGRFHPLGDHSSRVLGGSSPVVGD